MSTSEQSPEPSLLDARELLFEAHATLTVQRAGDPRFPQRHRRPDGAPELLLAPDSEPAQAWGQVLTLLATADDQLFPPPVGDEPLGQNSTQLRSVLYSLAGRIGALGFRRQAAMLRAAGDVGYLVTDLNQGTFTALQVEAFTTAVEAHLSAR